MSMPGGVGGLRREPHPTRLKQGHITKKPGRCSPGYMSGRGMRPNDANYCQPLSFIMSRSRK